MARTIVRQCKNASVRELTYGWDTVRYAVLNSAPEEGSPVDFLLAYPAARSGGKGEDGSKEDAVSFYIHVHFLGIT
jgi:hypothetical protein